MSRPICSVSIPSLEKNSCQHFEEPSKNTQPSKSDLTLQQIASIFLNECQTSPTGKVNISKVILRIKNLAYLKLSLDM